MPIRISLGVNKKLGLPAYSSVGASCQLEFEAESSLLREDLSLFFRKVQHAYGACTQAVDEQLARCQGAALLGATEIAAKPPLPVSRKAAATNGDGAAAGRPTNGTADRSGTTRASSAQLCYARQLAAQITGLGVRRLEKLAANLLHKPLAQLSPADARVLIETLQNILSGEADLDSLLEGISTAAG
jgi:hypothetical protein